MGRGLGALASGPPRCLCCFSSLFPRRDPTQAPSARWSHNLYLKCTSGHLPLLLKQTRAPGEQSAWQVPGLASESVAMSPQDAEQPGERRSQRTKLGGGGSEGWCGGRAEQRSRKQVASTRLPCRVTEPSLPNCCVQRCCAFHGKSRLLFKINE